MALEYLGESFDVQGGGSDLVFPHHEMCASEAQVLTGRPFAQAYVHAGMVGYDGAKMSKSRGNLVFVSALRLSEVDPMAIRLTLLRHHYRSDWEWTDAELWESVDIVDRWRRALALGAGAAAAPVVDAVLAALASDLDAPTAVAAVDAWVDATLGTHGLAETGDPQAAASDPRRARRLPRARSLTPSRHAPTRRHSRVSLRRLGVFCLPLCADSAVSRPRSVA